MDAGRIDALVAGLDRVELRRRPEGKGAEAPESAFASLVSDLLEKTNQTQVHAEQKAAEVARGEGDIVETMIALTRADLSLRYALTLRSRALEAYQEIMRLQI